jgi:hypothetical protein
VARDEGGSDGGAAGGIAAWEEKAGKKIYRRGAQRRRDRREEKEGKSRFLAALGMTIFWGGAAARIENSGSGGWR